MVLGVGIEKTPDHALILGVVLLCLGLEELDAAFAQGKRNFDSIIPKDQILRTRKKVGNNLKLSERLVCVFDFHAHRPAFPFAKTGSKNANDVVPVRKADGNNATFDKSEAVVPLLSRTM